MSFGSDYSEANNDIQIIGPTSEFSTGDQLAWVAHLKAPANASTLDLTLSSVTGTGTETETVVFTDSGPISDPTSTVLAAKNPEFAREPPGRYRFRISIKNTILAVGEFSVK